MPDPILLALLFVLALAYLAVGLAPFEFDFSRPGRFHVMFVTPWNGVLNWACFVPFGVLIAALSFVERPVLTAVVVCGLLSLAVEALQLYLPGRFSCLSDWLLNVAGAATGALLAIAARISA
jgi:glycopeptide antibiotics resistance protein